MKLPIAIFSGLILIAISIFFKDKFIGPLNQQISCIPSKEKRIRTKEKLIFCSILRGNTISQITYLYSEGSFAHEPITYSSLVI